MTVSTASNAPRVPAYPVRVDGTLDARLSRGLWLVKWLLALPHYVVLFFLWTAFVVLSVAAFVAILVTGRYPRTIFDFNVGVLRWTWRVTYYSYGALGTDRYPPFSLQERADYPAHLEIDYPEHLSRGLVLVKWWLLAIPHYLVVALFAGGGLYVATEAAGDDTVRLADGGLIGLLVLIAGVVLLFTGRYPTGVFDLVLGLNRWVLRVAAYAGLMTDVYPPFRLDAGPDDPGSHRLSLTSASPDGPAAPDVPTRSPVHPMAPDPSPPAPTPPAASSRWTAGRVLAVVVASVLVLLSGGLLTAGVLTAAVDSSMRDDGFVSTGTDTFTTSTYALTTENMEFHVGDAATWVPERLLGDVRLVVESGTDVFVGIAPTADVARYLDGVTHVALTDYRSTGLGTGEPVYREHVGDGVPDVVPADLDIWVASAAGTGTRSLTWTPTDGDWTVVLMDADAEPGVSADVAAAAELPVLTWLGPVLLVLGGLGSVAGAVVLVVAVRSARREAEES